MTVEQLGLLAAVVVLVGCLALVGALVLVRVGKDRAERRRARLRGPVWLQVLLLTTGEVDEAALAAAALAAVPRPGREAVVDDAFALVPKLRGDARERLRDVLRGWGLTDESRALATSRSVVRRCRGMHRLGVLADPDTLDVVVSGLDDRAFIVRRTALLAVGGFAGSAGAPAAVAAVFERTVQEPRLRRDFLATMDRIGEGSVTVLRDELTRAVAAGVEGERRGHVAAEALGLVGAISAVPGLESALAVGGVELRIACLEALGDLGVPSSTAAALRQLDHPDDEVRRAAVRALGRIGGPTPLDELATVLQDANVEVARAAARSLQQCGPVGMEVLRRSPAPVARETLALASLGVTA
jgi:HEAT repeat protein